MDSRSLGLREVPTAQLKKLLAHVHRGEVECPFTIVGLTCVGLQVWAEALLRHLRGRDKDTVVAVLVAVLAERAGQEEAARIYERRIAALEDRE